MTDSMNTENYTDRDWEELASFLSDEKSSQTGFPKQLMSEEDENAIKQWKELGKIGGENEIDVDTAWDNVLSRINETAEKTGKLFLRTTYRGKKLMKIAASVIVILGLGITGFYLTEKGVLSKKITVITDINQKNLEVSLPDGSVVILNRETVMRYRANYGKHDRKVSLSGEAFFEIVADPENPFTVDAGKAQVKVSGTSFNVITSNPGSAVEVFVKTGQVILSDNAGNKTLVIDPGYIGTINSIKSEKSLNKNPNYMAWNTGILVYDGQTLDVVFRDLKRVYNMEIIADDPSILTETWTSSINNQTQETIIRLICYSFNLGYTKDGNVYHLSKK